MENEVPDTDVFLWGNTIDAIKDQLDIELFLFSKTYALYSVNFSSELNTQMKPLFLYDILNYVNTGPSMGLVVRDFEAAETEENVLQKTKLLNVEKATHMVNALIYEEDDIVPFSEEEHEFKRIKGVIARFSHKSLETPFYTVKLIPQAQVLKGATSWMFNNGSFQPFSAEAGLRVMPDSQVLIVDGTIFVFNQNKFERLFGYDIKKQSIANKKVAEIEANFKLSFPEGLTLQHLIKDKKSTINKLQKVDPTLVKQEDMLNHAEEMGLELMTDEAGAIIIMDSKDLTTFVNLLNDDYVTSDLTGIKYEVKAKKRLDGEGDDKPAGV